MSLAQSQLKYAKEGTIVVMRKNIMEKFDIVEKVLIQNRIQILTCKNPSNNFTIINCYLSTHLVDRYKSINVLKNELENIGNDIILLGDFNFIENKIDTKNEHLFRLTKDKLAFKSLRTEFNLIDFFRKQNKTEKIFTFKNQRGATRIDRIYISEKLIPFIKENLYLPTIRTDHVMMPFIAIKCIKKIKWGNGFYKLNNEILKNDWTKDEIYNIWQIHKQTKSHFPNLNTWWETGKLLVKECLKNVSIEIKKSHRLEIDQIKNKLSLLNKDVTGDKELEIASLKENLQKLYRLNYEGARVRARMKKIENETPDKTFFETEKSKAKKNTLNEIVNLENKTIIEPDEILNETKNYYKQLWTYCPPNNESDIDEYLKIFGDVTFENEEIINIENHIHENEIKIAINLLVFLSRIRWTNG